MRSGIALGLALVAALAQPALAAAEPPTPVSLRVVGGEDWRPANGFTLRWANLETGHPIASTHYVVRNQAGAIVLGPTEIPEPVEEIDGIWAPGNGIYRAEVWVEDTTGAEGFPAAVVLRLDAGRPGQVEPLSPTGWISRNEIPYALRVTHPPIPHPVSGIRGYAISVDREPSASPCASAALCRDDEVDLRGGVDGDSLTIEELAEGRAYVHAVAVSGSGVRSAVAGHASIQVDKTDPLTRLSGLPGGWTNRPVTLEATATDALSGMSPASGAPFTAIRVDDAAPAVAPGDSVTTTVVAPGLHTISYYARDAAGNVDDGADSNGHENRPPSTVTLGIDREPPTVVFAGSTDPLDPELIEARVADRLSGPHPRRGEIAVRAVGSSEPFETLPTVGAGGVLLGRWRSEDRPPGSYEFRVTAYDSAGNAAVGTRRASGEPMVLPNPLKACAALTAGFGGGLGERAVTPAVRHGARVTYGGRLTMSSDAALEGRSVVVVERFDSGASEPRRATPVAVDGEGRFTLRLDPGPSREVFALFDGTSTTTGTASRPLRLGVRAGVRLRASAATATVGGRPVVFRGAVAAYPGELPQGGARVELQFRAAGVPWTEFRTVQADAGGRFRYAYRFSDDDSRGIHFRFRALVPTQSDWPYEAGASGPVRVRGR